MPSGSARPLRTSSVCGKVRDDTRNTALLARRRLLRIQPVEHRHRLGRGGAFVEQRRRRDLHPREIADHRLEVQQRLEAPLGDFRLVRRVGRVPAGVLEHVAQDHGGRVRVVVPHPDAGARHRVLRRDAAQPAQVAGLGLGRRQVQPLRKTDAGRDGLVDQRVERRDADRAQHLVLRRRVRDRCGGT